MPPTTEPSVPTGASGPTRRTPLILAVVAAALLLARIGACVMESRSPSVMKELVSWQAIPAAETLAQQTRKPILYYFTAEWCPPCHQMKREIFSEKKHAAAIEQMFVPVQVLDRSREDGHNAPEVQALQDRYKVEAFPTMVVVSARGGAPIVLEGYQSANNTMNELRSAATRRR